MKNTSLDKASVHKSYIKIKITVSLKGFIYLVYIIKFSTNKLHMSHDTPD